jgi:hypothetical protein
VCEHWRRLGEDWRHFSASEQQNPATVYVAPRRGFDFSHHPSVPTPPWLQVQRAKGAEFVWLAMLGINGVRDESAR